jgi:hypothetical protein
VKLGEWRRDDEKVFHNRRMSSTGERPSSLVGQLQLLWRWRGLVEWVRVEAPGHSGPGRGQGLGLPAGEDDQGPEWGGGIAALAAVRS